jgi:hypothetical protein
MARWLDSGWHGGRRTGVACLLLAVSPACHWLDRHAAEYADYAAAERAGAVGKDGDWIPGRVPKSARDIRIAYDVTTTEVWLAFTFDAEADLLRVTGGCTTAAAADLTHARSRPQEWWPPEFAQGDGSPAPRRPSLDVRTYRCSPPTFLVIREGTAYYWDLGDG